MTDPENAVERWLRGWLAKNGGSAGTVHVREADELRLSAAVNIPPKVVEVVRSVPRGKGMAGQAFERDVPISTCNLQTTTNPDVRPGAKAVDANAAVAIPIHDATGAVRAVVGIAFMGERELPDSELVRLSREAEQAPC